jgi:hypothetical protein
MTDELDRRAGKGSEDDHPLDEPDRHSDPSDHADPRVTQPGDDAPGEDAMRRPTDAGKPL